METKTLIIGGGITGLSAASFLPHSDYLVLEKDSIPGGYCKTTIRGDYTWDYSGHFFHFNNPEIKAYEYRDWETDRKSTRLNSSHSAKSRMPSSA